MSRGEANVPDLVVSSQDEVGALTASFNRMRVSLAKALAMLEE